MAPGEEPSPEEFKLLGKQNKRLERRVRQLERLVRTSENLARQSHCALERSMDGLRQRTEDLERAKLAAEAGLVAKDRFLATMSHEIRTPMNGVIGCIDLLSATGLAGEQLELVDTLKGSAETLMVLLNDVLDFAKLKGGHATVENRAFHVAELVRSVIQPSAATSATKGLDLKVAVCKKTPAEVIGDSHRLRQILGNLVNNAIKFTHVGSVTLCIEPDPGPTQGDEASGTPGDSVNLRFSVRDTGIGMDSEVQDMVFNAFTQADESTTRRFGGTGLGLAISRTLVDAMGGQLKVSSELGRGSEFSFTIAMDLPERVSVPVGIPHQTAPPGGAEASGLGASKRLLGAKVLVVDDNPVNRVVAHKMITRLGCEVHLADGGEVAVAMAEESDWDLILMDCSMPGMDGFEAVDRIRALDSPRNATRVVALTALSLAGDRERCLRSGMDDYLQKPLRLEALRVTLERWCPGRAA